jgi:hypothetical protein
MVVGIQFVQGRACGLRGDAALLFRIYRITGESWLGVFMAGRSRIGARWDVASEYPEASSMLAWLAWLSLGLSFASAIAIVIDELRHPQKMWIMNIVWPVTAFYLSLIGVWWYFRAGRAPAKDAPAMTMKKDGEEKMPPNFAQIALATSHCAAGCALADIAIESIIFKFGLTIGGSPLFASYALDFVAAWSLGILFQYFTIKPMLNLSAMDGLKAAIRADTFSILAFQVGMYAWMSLVYYRLFPAPHLTPNQPVYWLMMQVAMICGFMTSFPMNRLLVSIGWKEKMG